MKSSVSPVSVIVVTRNRLDKLLSCIQSLSRSSVSNFELIIIDQSDKPILNEIKKNLVTEKFRYFHQADKGLSVGRNFGIRHAHGEILCFTDDDCVISRSWLKNICEYFFENNKIAGIFGSTKPYKPNQNRSRICPSVLDKKGTTILDKPRLHYKYIGFGNNMAFRRNSFLKYGLFKEWLGVNSPGLSAEDAEFALRLLVNKQKILSAKDVVVYHNKWLSHKELSKQMKLYICGELSCYGYFAIKGYKFAKKVCLDDFNNVFSRLKKSIKRIYLLKTGGVSLFKNTLFEFTFMIRGLAVAYYFNCRERQQIQ